MEGGPECQKGGVNSFFPTFSGGAKGITGETKGVGLDLGAFLTSDVDDDVPDFHARSVKTVRVEREADFVGKGTEISDLE